MPEEKTRIGTALHPHVYARDDRLAMITMRISLAEREGWVCKRPVFINYANSGEGKVVQFEDCRGGYSYACHFSLKQLLKSHFEGTCPWLLAQFACELNLSVEALLVEALNQAR